MARTKNETELNLDCLSLTSLPPEIEELTQLQTLDLMANRALTQLPESLSTLQNLRRLDLDHCSNLSTLPAGFERLPARASVHATDTGLSPNVFETLGRAIEQERVSSNRQRGPRIEVSLPAAATRPVQSLGQEIMLWFEEANQQPQFTQALLRERLSRLPSEAIRLTASEALNTHHPKNQSEALATLLMRLRKTGHYTRAQSDMKQRVCNLLNGMMEHEEVLQTAGMMAFEGIQTCDDRTALSMLIMELDLVQHQAVQAAKQEQPAPNSPERRAMFQSIVKLGQGVFKETKLMDIAHKQAKEARGIVDETEIVLKYVTHLSQALDLPVKWSNMLYEGCANIVTEAHLKKAKSNLKNAATLDNPEFLSFLSTWQPLRSLLETFEPEALAQINAGIRQLEATRRRKQEKLEEELERAITTHGEESTKALNLVVAMNKNQRFVEKQAPALWLKAIKQVIRE